MQQQPKTVLVVDDEPHILRVVSYKLRGAGYSVLEAGNGEEAWELLQTSDVDLVLTDQQMPLMTGLELVETMRTLDRTSNVPVLMLTARGFRLERDELARADVLAMISKPFSPRLLLRHVEEAIGPAGGMQERAIAA